jgi:hypothetical protein
MTLIENDMTDRVTHLGRRSQRARVVALGEELAAPVEDTVEPPRHPDFEALHTSRERLRSIRLDDEVEVIG